MSIDLAVTGIPESNAKKAALSAAVNLTTGSEILDIPYGLLTMTVRGRGFAEIHTHEADLALSATSVALEAELDKAEELVMAMAKHAELRSLLSDERLGEAMLEIFRETPRASELLPRLGALARRL